MKYFIVLVSCLILLAFAGPATVFGSHTEGAKSSEENAGTSPQTISWEVPIAAGIYYPSDGPVPAHPVRYYRVRCWPGCHTGSSLGKYPDKPLQGTPIFPTSTIDGHSGNINKKE
jgi:hypothetical protein